MKDSDQKSNRVAAPVMESELMKEAVKSIQAHEGETDFLLTEREKTHGIFHEQTTMSQSIKDVIKSGKNWSKLSDQQKEALEMISVKIARILSGNPNYRDHWEDIAGYAKLGGENSPMDPAVIEKDIKDAMG